MPKYTYEDRLALNEAFNHLNTAIQRAVTEMEVAKLALLSEYGKLERSIDADSFTLDLDALLSGWYTARRNLENRIGEYKRVALTTGISGEEVESFRSLKPPKGTKPNDFPTAVGANYLPEVLDVAATYADVQRSLVPTPQDTKE